MPEYHNDLRDRDFGVHCIPLVDISVNNDTDRNHYQSFSISLIDIPKYDNHNSTQTTTNYHGHGHGISLIDLAIDIYSGGVQSLGLSISLIDIPSYANHNSVPTGTDYHNHSICLFDISKYDNHNSTTTATSYLRNRNHSISFAYVRWSLSLIDVVPRYHHDTITSSNTNWCASVTNLRWFSTVSVACFPYQDYNHRNYRVRTSSSNK